jgi:hypothetical protein
MSLGSTIVAYLLIVGVVAGLVSIIVEHLLIWIGEWLGRFL